jgi:hypothetical protein
MTNKNDLRFQQYLTSDDENLLRLRDDLWNRVDGDVPYQSKHRMRDALRYIVINAILGYRLGKKVHYSRRKSVYATGIYSLPWFSHKCMVSQIDWLVRNGYLEHTKGSNGTGKESTFSATEKMVQLFIDYKINKVVFERLPKKPPIIMKDKWMVKNWKRVKSQPPKPVSYRVDPPVRRMLDFLETYNDFVDTLQITGAITGDKIIKVKHLVQVMEMELYAYGLIDSVGYSRDPMSDIKVINDKLNPLYTDLILNNSILSSLPGIFPEEVGGVGPVLLCGTNQRRLPPVKELQRSGFSGKALFLETVFGLRQWFKQRLDNATEDEYHQIRNENSKIRETKFQLDTLGIAHINFTLLFSKLHRVFNERNWNKGGRFYGAAHIMLGGAPRKCIIIDGEPCVELDYSGLHIRMLYHKEGLDFGDECYVYHKGENDLERNRMKLLQLIAINANKEDAPGAIGNAWISDGIFPENEEHPIKDRIKIFMDYHKPVSQYLFTGIGIDLQYLDSIIMEHVLKDCLAYGIPALPVHDSVVVPRSGADRAREIMMENYHKVMKFYPIID